MKVPAHKVEFHQFKTFSGLYQLECFQYLFSNCILMRKGIFYFTQQVNKYLSSSYRMSHIALSKFITSLQVPMKHGDVFPELL